MLLYDQYDPHKTVPRPTGGVLAEGLLKFGLKHDKRHILRVASELGIQLSQGRRGRPKAKR